MMILKILQSFSVSLYPLHEASVNTIKGTCFLCKSL